jgi:hypothetical protein
MHGASDCVTRPHLLGTDTMHVCCLGNYRTKSHCRLASFLTIYLDLHMDELISDASICSSSYMLSEKESLSVLE